MLIKHYWHKVCFHFVCCLYDGMKVSVGETASRLLWHHAKWRLAGQFKVIFAERHLFLNVNLYNNICCSPCDGSVD